MQEARQLGEAGRVASARTVLGVGIATLDVINEVADYPCEDAEIRALAHRRTRGGNVTNSLVVLSQLGHRCRWVGMLGDDAGAEVVLADLARYAVDARDVVRIAGAVTPSSYILSSRASGSRTIVHFRDLPELDAAGFERVSLQDIGWVHFEGRNPVQTAAMIRRVRAERPDVPVSLELEKLRPGMDALLRGPEVLLASRAYAEAAGFATPGELLEHLAPRTTARLCVVAWGDRGASYLDRHRGIHHIPAYTPTQIRDTLGAGDVLNAGVIHGLLRGRSTHEAVVDAVRLSGIKCGHIGLAIPGEAIEIEHFVG